MRKVSSFHLWVYKLSTLKLPLKVSWEVDGSFEVYELWTLTFKFGASSLKIFSKMANFLLYRKLTLTSYPTLYIVAFLNSLLKLNATLLSILYTRDVLLRYKQHFIKNYDV